MKKQNLVDFISRFYLQGNLTKDSSGDWYPVVINVESGIAKVSVRTSDLAVLCQVDQNVEMPDGEFVVGNIKQLISMLGAFGTDVNLELKKVRQDYFNVMMLKDPSLEATIALADPVTVEDRPSLKSTPPTELTFDLKKTFIEKFVKAKKALNDAQYFAVFPDSMNSSVDFIVNYNQDQNTNNIKVNQTEVKLTDEFDPIFFNCNNFTAILQENSDFLTATISVSSKGLMIVSFKGEDWEGNYYLKSYQM